MQSIYRLNGIQGGNYQSLVRCVINNIPKVEPVRKTLDVTDKLNEYVKDGILTLTVNNEITGGKDPARQSVKEIRVEYLCNGVRGWTKVHENKILILPIKP
jgi:hypothetical protein